VLNDNQGLNVESEIKAEPSKKKKKNRKKKSKEESHAD